jgi:hypothetical protein
MPTMANILSRVLTQNQTCTADSLRETQALCVHREEFSETSDGMSEVMSNAVGSWRG